MCGFLWQGFLFLVIFHLSHFTSAILQRVEKRVSNDHFILPIEIPKLLQDPQHLSRGQETFFGLAEGGDIFIDLQVSLVGQYSSRDGKHREEKYSTAGSGYRQKTKQEKIQKDLTVDSCLESRESNRSLLDSLLSMITNLLKILSQQYERVVDNLQLESARRLAVHLSFDAPTNAGWFRKLLEDSSLDSHSKRFSDESNVAASVPCGEFDVKSDSRWWSNGEYENHVVANLDFGNCSSISSTNLDNSFGDLPENGLKTNDSWGSVEDVYLFAMTVQQWIDSRFAIPPFGAISNPRRMVWSSQLRSFLRIPVTSHVKMHHSMKSSQRLMFFVLNARAQRISMEGTITLINPGGVHLSTDQYAEGSCAALLLVLYLSLAAALSTLLVTIWRGEKQTAIHMMMLASALMKCSYMYLDWDNIRLFSKAGHIDPFRWVLPRMVAKIEDIISLMIFLLLALGWRVYRNSLSLLEVRFCAGICVLSFYLGVFEVSMGGFQVSRYILHALAYLCVIVAINFDIVLLGANLSEQGITFTTGETYRNLSSYRKFRWIFVIFFMKPTILLFYKLAVLEENVTPFPDDNDNEWIVLLLDNLWDLGIFISLVYAFRPVQPIRLIKALLLSEPQDETLEEESISASPNILLPPASAEENN